MKSIIEALEKLVKNSKVKIVDGRVEWVPPSGGAILSGKKQTGDGSQKENQEPLITIRVPIHIRGTKKSPWWIKDNKDGIKFQKQAAGSRMSYVHFLNAGEDCVTNYAENLLIDNCVFEGDDNSDKCIQANRANGLVVRNCTFYRFITGVQCGLKKYAHKNDYSSVYSCKFVGVETPVKAVRGQVKVANNIYESMKTGNVEDSGGKII